MPIKVARPIARSKLSDAVEQELERMIQQGELKEGERLPSERELMAIFDVGRPSIREGLSALSQKGLIKISSGSPARVTRPDPEVVISNLSGLAKSFMANPEGIHYFEQVREFLELSLVRYAAANASQEQINRLGEALRANKDAIGDHARFAKTDAFFHRVIAEIPENPIFVAMHQALVDWLLDSQRVTDRKNLSLEEFHREVARGHERIFNCIKTRDVEGSYQAVKDHLKLCYIV